MIPLQELFERLQVDPSYVSVDTVVMFVQLCVHCQTLCASIFPIPLSGGISDMPMNVHGAF